jgi:hypothetical protein
MRAKTVCLAIGLLAGTLPRQGRTDEGPPGSASSGGMQLAAELRVSERISGEAADALLVLKTDASARWEGLVGGGYTGTGDARGVDLGAGARVFARLGVFEPHLGAELWWIPYQDWKTGWQAPYPLVRWDHAVVLQAAGGVRVQLGGGVYADLTLGVGQITNPGAAKAVDGSPVISSELAKQGSLTVLSGQAALGFRL